MFKLAKGSLSKIYIWKTRQERFPGYHSWCRKQFEQYAIWLGIVAGTFKNQFEASCVIVALFIYKCINIGGLFFLLI